MARLKSNLVEDTIEEIMNRIKNHKYAAGETVSEVSLATELNISRTPVREAIMKLLDYGVLERLPTKVVVKPLTLRDIEEILEVRQAIEGMSIQIILSNGGLSKEQLIELEKSNSLFEKSIDNKDYSENFAQDDHFHELLVSFTSNSRFEDFTRRINIQSQRARWITMMTPSRHMEAVNEHKEVLLALKNHDEKAAKAALSRHFYNSLENYKLILGEDRWLKIIQELKGIT